MVRHRPQLARAADAATPRTLIQIFQETAERFPDSSALDDGRTSLSYAELLRHVSGYARRLHQSGIGAGDRVGVRIPSGTNELYVAILAILSVGAAYVPVEADDPDERARVVFEEAGVAGFVRAGEIAGSTGTPKGVADTHRSAAAFVDAEARLFCKRNRWGPRTGPGRIVRGI